MVAAWGYALDAGRLREAAPNWWHLIMRGRLRSKGRVVQGELARTTRRVLDTGELATLIKWLPNFLALSDDVLTLYLWTCARRSEILAMERVLPCRYFLWREHSVRTDIGLHARWYGASSSNRGASRNAVSID